MKKRVSCTEFEFIDTFSVKDCEVSVIINTEQKWELVLMFHYQCRSMKVVCDKTLCFLGHNFK